MQGLTILLTSMLLSAAASAQEPLQDAELLEEAEPEIRRYTVEVIVFSYVEDVSIGTELFLPDIGKPDQPRNCANYRSNSSTASACCPSLPGTS